MKLQRLLRVAPLALLFASVASAQTTGNIIGVVTDAQSGKPVVGALVVATSPASQGEQTAVTDKSGGFRFQLLPPGDYKLATSFDGFKPSERSDLTVRVDKTIRANLSLVPDAVQMEEQVVKTGVSPVINVGSAETGSVVSREFLSNIPGSRSFENVAITAPMAQFDRYGVSFAGASSPENGYLIDGMNVGDAAYGTLGGQILNNFVQEIDIKTGSFMPEYGFATGGIMSVVTKSGSNEFHGSVFGSLTPGSLSADPKVIGRNAEALASKLLPKDGTYQADFGFEVGGPIMKDRLWFYAGFAPQLSRRTFSRFQQYTTEDPANLGQAVKDGNGFAVATPIEGGSRKITNKIDAYQLVAKLTYLFNENNQVALSVVTVPSKSSGFATANAAPSYANYDNTDDFADVVARYSSKLLDKKLQFELTGGYHRQSQTALPTSTAGSSTSQMVWSGIHPLGDLEALGSGVGDHCKVTASGFDPCKVQSYSTGGIGYFDETVITRLAAKAALTYFAEAAGTHQLKGGVDIQKSTYNHTKGYTGPNANDSGGDFLGGAVLVEETGPGYVNGDLPALTAAHPLPYDPYGYVINDYRRYGSIDDLWLKASDSPGGKIKVKSETTIAAYYLQDSYQPSFLDGLTLNVGVRWETQSMGVPDQPGAQSLSINNSIGPRLQAVYDWTRQGRSKVAASWGRFFSSFPLDMADRAFGDERQIVAYREGCVDLATVTDKNSLAGRPEKCAVIKGYLVDANNNLVNYQPTGSSSTPVAPDIKSPYVDMFGGSVEYEIFADMSVGFDYQGRRQGRIIEDMSPNDGQSYAIANPGEGNPFPIPGAGMFDPKNVVALDRITRRSYSAFFPKPERSYDGFTFSLKKNFSSNWQAQASYTYSSLRGNYPGFFRPETGQLDPGITSMFDLASLLANSSGPLPGDMPHSFKAYGSYAWDFGPSLQVMTGTALRITSGTPVNYLVRHPLYGNGEGYGLPRGSAGRTPTLTTWDLKGGITYTITPPYKIAFTADIFNILNAQKATSVDNNWTFGSSSTSATQVAIGGQCASKNAASKSNPIEAALADCPDLQYLKGNSGTPVTINTNFAKPTAYQTPLSVRFGLELSF